MPASETIYVALLDEGTAVWRPVEAARLPTGLYRIMSENQEPEIEKWAFPSGAIVRCEERKFSGGVTALVAVESSERPEP